MKRHAFRSATAAAATLALGALASCATGPTRNAAIDAAQQRLAQDQQNPAIHQYGSSQLTEAQQSLAAARQAASDDNTALLNHQLFMTDRALSTAEAQGQAEAARAHLAQLNQERDQTLLQARTAQLQQTQRELRAYQTKETSQGTVVTLYNLPFETGRASLRPGAAVRLQPLVSYLKEHPDRQVIVQGNTDSTGSPQFNQELSQQRADAVRNYLVTAGIPEDRVVAKGLGSSFPVASNSTAAGRQENRRVDVVIEPNSSTAAMPEASQGASPPQ